MVGGGNPVRPGEVTLSHRGVLFLDDANELRRSVCESLGSALTAGKVTMVRKGLWAEYPAKPELVIAAVNPCLCGFANTLSGGPKCSCSEELRARYRESLRNGFLAQFPIRITLPPWERTASTEEPMGESSATVQARVTKAREVAKTRGHGVTREVKALLIEANIIHPPQVDMVVGVAWTIASLDGKTTVEAKHLAEAIALTESV